MICSTTTTTTTTTTNSHSGDEVFDGWLVAGGVNGNF